MWNSCGKEQERKTVEGYQGLKGGNTMIHAGQELPLSYHQCEGAPKAETMSEDSELGK